MNDMASPRYQSISAATDWFFVFSSGPGPDGLTVWPVAMWALNADGKPVGLVSTPEGSDRLVKPPPYTNGQYKHFRQLNEAEQAAICKF
jgi:hypothetical protein